MIKMNYNGGLTWVIDGILQTGIDLPISMSVKLEEFSGKVIYFFKEIEHFN